MEAITIFLWGSSGRGFRFLTEHFEAISKLGIILLAVLTGIAVIVAYMSHRWYPAIVKKIAKRHFTDVTGMVIPKLGIPLVIGVFGLILPVFGLFSSNPDTWWIFMIVGWVWFPLMVGCIVNEMKLRTAVMRAENEWWISGRGGLGDWIVLRGMGKINIQESSEFNRRIIIIKCSNSKGREKNLGVVPRNGYAPSDRRLISELMTDMATE